MKKKLLSKVEKAQMLMKGIPTPEDIETFNEASEKMQEIEEKVSKLTAKQLSNIFRKYQVPVINTLESLKLSIKNDNVIRGALQYKSLKSVL
jgi:hypothetical protein